VLHVDLRPGTSPSTWGATHPDLFVSPTGGIRAGILSQFDGVTNIAVVLLVITVLVGVLGLANTLAMDVLDRQREIGVLRALGTQRREVRAMILAQSLILTSVAGVLAVMLGTILGAASVVGTKTDGLGLPVSFHYPVRAVPLILGAALLVGGLAAITPARMASRMEPADAVRLPAEA
jgi:putative ABC transport system permease protein